MAIFLILLIMAIKIQSSNPFTNHKHWFRYFAELSHSSPRLLPERNYIFKWKLSKELHDPLISYLRKVLVTNDQHLKKYVDEANLFILTLISCEHEINDDYCKILIPCKGLEIIAFAYVLFNFWCNSNYQDKYSNHLFKGFYARAE